jgi:HK97 family phage prohead protease
MHSRKRELRYLPARELRISTAADGSKTLSGYAIVFGVRSVNLGGFVEIVDPKAVSTSLRTQDILCLNNHDSSQPLSRTSAGTLKLTTDSTGVAFTCSLDTRISYANDLAISVERGDTRGCSFGFQTNRDTWTNDNGTLLRTLNEIEVFEISVCSSPAYPQTDVSVRSIPKEFRSLLKRSMDDEGDDSDSECECDCPECEDGNCAECSDPECDDPNCDHGEDSARSIDMWRLNTQLAIALRR